MEFEVEKRDIRDTLAQLLVQESGYLKEVSKVCREASAGGDLTFTLVGQRCNKDTCW